VRASTGGRCAQAMLMAERRWLGADARAREQRPGLAYKRTGGRLGVGATCHLPTCHGRSPRRAHPTRVRRIRRVADVATHDVTAERASGDPGRFQFAEAVFKLNFLWIFKLKCTLWSTAKLKITHPSTTFTKVGRDVTQRIKQEIVPSWPNYRRQ
jgi:hypothetical protein